ncbi:glutaminyl-peptide cyclotransferase-like isoform X2 [Dysidea avara]|uniref:glutaminyl-peptide cyclotransferase-like isoform X2 n=1 Tax=Dysidea avara TaxID=196820 RepID=UPI00331B0C97
MYRSCRRAESKLQTIKVRNHGLHKRKEMYHKMLVIQELTMYIITRLEQLGPRWKVTLDSFSSQTPLGEKSFTNIVATLDPHIDRRLVLSAHYDTKIIDGSTTKFLGATDSALPCALLLDMAHALNTKLQARKLEEISLQLIFFDGEEAFVRWTNQDSIYGSRHLAEEMAKDNGLLSIGAKTGIKAMEAMVLLDLIGAKLPAFQNFFDETRPLYEQLAKIEERLHKVDHLEGHSKSNIYFPSPTLQYGRIEDDHIPFLKKGVPILHLIAYPFPSVWHKASDNLSALDKPTISNLRKIFIVFLHEYFYLK